MKSRIGVYTVAIGLWLITGGWLSLTQAGETDSVRSRSDQSFDRLRDQQSRRVGERSLIVGQSGEDGTSAYSSEHYWIGKGQGDLTKGKVICQRVSELSARTDLAKQIRVLVKEHLIDRVRERSGRETEQDIELTREEIVQEYLQDVKIVDRQIDEENKTCTATAVMPKRQTLPKLPDQAASPSDTHQ